jgi:hypothetical protein
MMVSTKNTARPALRSGEPPRRLMAAVLQTVVDDYRGSAYRRGAHHQAPDVRGARRALAYMENTDRTWPFSFENLCDALDIDACGFRRELEKSDSVGWDNSDGGMS